MVQRPGAGTGSRCHGAPVAFDDDDAFALLMDAAEGHLDVEEPAGAHSTVEVGRDVRTLVPTSEIDTLDQPSGTYSVRMESLVLSIIGADRAGLVKALSEVVAQHGAGWERSHLTELAGVFAGVVLVRVPSERRRALQEALQPLHDRGLLDVTVRPAAAEEQEDVAQTVVFEVVGADRPGIVHEVSRLMASLGVGIVDLRTWTESAAMAGSPLFRAAAVVRLPEDVSRWDLVAALEDLSDDLMVDVGVE